MYCYVLTTVTLFSQECPKSSSKNFKRFKFVLPDSFSRPLNALMLHQYIPSRSLRSSADTRTFGIPKQKKKFQGQRTFPIWALSHGISFHTLYAVLQQNPSLKLNSKPQPMDQTPKKLFSLPNPPPPTPLAPRPVLFC